MVTCFSDDFLSWVATTAAVTSASSIIVMVALRLACAAVSWGWPAVLLLLASAFVAYDVLWSLGIAFALSMLAAILLRNRAPNWAAVIAVLCVGGIVAVVFVKECVFVLAVSGGFAAVAALTGLATVVV